MLNELVRGLRFLSACLIFVAGLSGQGEFRPVPGTTAWRTDHTSTLLSNGKVLIAGGRDYCGCRALSTAELFDASTGGFRPTGDMTVVRGRHTATLLDDGRVLMVDASSAELYDPSTGTFAPTGGRRGGKGDHQAALLSDGRVLIVDEAETTFAEIYDPATGVFTEGGRSASAWFSPVALGMADHRVLLMGLARVEIYDPKTQAFLLAGLRTPNYVKSGHSSTVLLDGRVLVAGGSEVRPSPWDYPGISDAVELFDPASSSFSAAGRMASMRGYHSATRLSDGSVLVVGGFGCEPVCGALRAAERFDLTTSVFTRVDGLLAGRHEHSAVLLQDGRVLITGGWGSFGWPPGEYSLSPVAEVYAPAVIRPAVRLFSTPLDGREQGAVLHAGTGLLASPASPAAEGDYLEIYCTGLLESSVIPPVVTLGGKRAEIVYFGQAPGYEGLNQINIRVPGSVPPGASVPLRVRYLDRFSNEVSIAVR